MSYNSELSANNAELREILEGVQALPSAGGSGIPAGMGIKYIIPCRFTPPRTADDMGFDAYDYTFKRENVHQHFLVDWHLMDETNDTAGLWIQHYMITMCMQGNYPSQHNVNISWCGHGVKGNTSGSKSSNYPKTALSHTLTAVKNVGSTEGYNMFGQNYKGLMLIMDSTYNGMPIVDASKLADFFVCDYVQAGW